MKLIKIARRNETLNFKLSNGKTCFFTVDLFNEIKFIISDSETFNKHLFANTAQSVRITKDAKFVKIGGAELPQFVTNQMKTICGFQLVDETETQKAERIEAERKIAVSDWVISGAYDRE
jgi:hypothetical protein